MGSTSHSSLFSHCFQEFSGLTIFLVTVNVLNIKTSGGIISLPRHRNSFQSIQTTAQSLNYQSKYLDPNENSLILYGPDDLTVLCSSVNESSLSRSLEDLFQSLTVKENANEENLLPPPSASSSAAPPPAVAVLPTPPMMTNFTLQVTLL
jgi:hypothetical protein